MEFNTNAIATILFASAALTTSAAQAGATADNAMAMVKEVVANVKANGTEQAAAEIANIEGVFRKDDLYLVIYGLHGTVRAHGLNQMMVGKNLAGLKDIRLAVSASEVAARGG